MLTTWIKKSRGNPTTNQFPIVKRISDAVMFRQSVKLVFLNELLEKLDNLENQLVYNNHLLLILIALKNIKININ